MRSIGSKMETNRLQISSELAAAATMPWWCDQWLHRPRRREKKRN